jgi:DNA repair photolyase
MTTTIPPRAMMNGKPVFTRPAKTVINFESAFSHKLLCDGPTFSTGDACVYKCAFCYVPDLIRKLRATPVLAGIHGKHEDIVIRRGHEGGMAELARQQLLDGRGRRRFPDAADRRVIYSSPLVDVAGNMELVRETIEVCKVILELTNWQIRLLSKSNLLPKVAQGLEDWKREGDLLSCKADKEDTARARMIYGVSTGTLDDDLAQAFEEGAPLVRKRIESLHWLQDNGFRTFGMICPSLPQGLGMCYALFAQEMAAAIRAERCEHVWAEVINLRGESFTRTMAGLVDGGFTMQAELLQAVSSDKDAWELYARNTFEAHARFLPKGKLRFLQYVTPATAAWWSSQAKRGAVVL